MSTLELVLNMLAEATTTEISKEKNPQSFSEKQKCCKRGAEKSPEMHEKISRKEQENL